MKVHHEFRLDVGLCRFGISQMRSSVEHVSIRDAPSDGYCRLLTANERDGASQDGSRKRRKPYQTATGIRMSTIARDVWSRGLSSSR